MRDPGSRAPWSMTVWIMSALVIVFAATQVDEVHFRSGILRHLMLSVEGIQRGEIWRLLTFQFLHGGLMHLLGNLLGLWFCGRFIETVTGPWRFLLLYPAYLYLVAYHVIQWICSDSLKHRTLLHRIWAVSGLCLSFLPLWLFCLGRWVFHRIRDGEPPHNPQLAPRARTAPPIDRPIAVPVLAPQAITARSIRN